MLLRKIILCFLFASLCASCSHVKVDNTSVAQWLPFIEGGKTTKDEILLKLGDPSRQFERGRIVTYPMNFNEKEGFRVDYKREFVTHCRSFQKLNTSVSTAEYNLIFVFDDKNILSKYNLLRVRP